jgi:hypothetical protein
VTGVGGSSCLQTWTPVRWVTLVPTKRLFVHHTGPYLSASA